MSELWHQAKEILALALEQEPESRGEFIRQACGTDDVLRSEVESLLSHHSQADSLLEKPVFAGLFGYQPRPAAGSRLGPYRIIGEIGQGGMATVFLGERDDEQFRKRVAIKMLRPGFHPGEVLQRFRNERQTLASLDHPNIVRLLDGGATADGLPYLVMDHVEGAPIDQYCRNCGLALRERLELFLRVCGPVEHAHEKGVIHRDLKPGNILITSEGTPRLLDFGIAKLLNSELVEAPLTTRSECRPMTLEYASPEQVRGEVVTRASDIYSLGVLLYELVAGERPFRAEKRSRLEMERLVCEQEPERPSARAARAAPGQRRRVEGDLDTIVLKALRKEPGQRYASVGEFAEDIQRYLEGRPVRARKPTAPYRAGRFLRRHKEAVASAVIVLSVGAAAGLRQLHRSAAPAGPVRHSIAVLGFKNLSGRAESAWISTALSQMLGTNLEAGEELRIIPQERVSRVKADLSLEDAETVDRNLMARVRRNLGGEWVLVGSYGEWQRGGIEFNARLEDLSNGETMATVSETGSEAGLPELATRAGQRLRQRLKLSGLSVLESEQIRAAWPGNSDASRYYSEALEKAQRFDSLGARDLLAKVVGADPKYAVGHSALAAAWSSLGYDPKAREEAQQALATADKLSREDRLLVEARSYETARDWEKAITAYRVLVSFFPDNPEYGMDLANAQISGGKGKEAIETLSSLARRNAVAEDDPRVDLGMANAATVLGDNRLRRDAAERAARKADQVGARLVAARARNAECRALANLGEMERAREVCEQGRRLFEAAGDRGGLARLLHNMAEVPLDQGDLAAAAQLYQQALAIMQEIGDLRGTATELVNLGLVSAKQGDFAAGLRMYAESFRDYEQVGDKNGMAVASGNRGNLLKKQGRLDEALADYQQALSLANELGRRGSAALALSAIGDVRAEQGDLGAARELDQQALAIQRQIAENSYAADTLLSLGRVYMQQAQTDQASEVMRESLVIKQGLGDKEGVAESQLGLAEFASDSGNLQEGEALARAAMEEFQAEKQPDKIILAGTLLARLLRQSSKLAEAAEVAGQAGALARQNPSLAVRFDLQLEEARLMAVKGDFGKAEHTVRQVLTHAAGNWRLRFEASLVLCEIALQRDRREGRRRMEELVRSARAKGFEAIARKALAAGGQATKIFDPA